MNGKEYLVFTKRERNGIIALVVIVLTVAIVPKLFLQEEPVVINIPQHSIERLLADNESAYRHPVVSSDSGDNKANSKHSKAGRTFQKMKTRAAANSFVQPFEINAADTTAFIALPGIGSKLASRIVLFRDKLGGFFHVRQIGEVYGLHDSVFRKLIPYLRCDSSLVRKIDVNKANVDVLKSHPYIRWKNANAIVLYRSEHGRFNNVDDLKAIENIDTEELNKFIAYVSF